MRAHVLMHVDFEGPGSMATWFASHGYLLTFTRFYEDIPSLPELSEIDVLVVMGGPMSVNDEAEFPWLAVEKRFVRAAIHAGKPVLGVCLGAQLIASALDARVYSNTQREIGWFPVRATETAEEEALFAFPEQIEVFHWHGETFELPPDAILLASSSACRNQAFQYGSKVIGLQFHLETTQESARAIVDHCREQLVPAEYVQDEARILAPSRARYEAINLLMGDVLDFLTEQ
jgi:GMP synthase-like glutamine amidotransferase